MPEPGPLLTLLPEGRTVEAVPGRSLLDALVRAGTPVASACGGNGVCGKCRVRVQGALPEPDGQERAHLPAADLEAGCRLACRVHPDGPLTVDVSGHAEAAARITVHPGASTRPGANGAARPCVAAVDIGTTGVKVAVMDAAGGRELAAASLLNPQRIHGHDVMSRIQAAGSPEAARTMTRLIREAVTDALLRCLEALGAPSGTPDRLAVSGNTVMLHLFLGQDVTGLGRYPYSPVSLDAWRGEAPDLGMAGLGRAEVLCLPAISAYLGGDLVAGLLALDGRSHGSRFLLMDVGTNSEIILSDSRGVTATSCAAGPAIEGMNLSCGMTAAPGAVDDVRLDAEAHVSTIDDRPALGLCGSGIISLLAEMVRSGVVDEGGRMRDHADLPPGLRRRLDQGDGVTAFRVTDTVRFTQQDVRQVQLAKGAVLSGLRALLERTGTAPEDVDRVCIAGEFGRNLDLDDLLRLGFLDRFPRAEHVFVGNTSLAGAAMVAREPGLLDRASALTHAVRAFPLSTHEGYQDLFIRCLQFPPARHQERTT